MGVWVTCHVMMRPGRRNIGPSYSQAQFPGGSWRWEKYSMAFPADCKPVLGGDRYFRSCAEGPKSISFEYGVVHGGINDGTIQWIDRGSTCQPSTEASLLLPCRSPSNARFVDLVRPVTSIDCSLSCRYGRDHHSCILSCHQLLYWLTESFVSPSASWLT